MKSKFFKSISFKLVLLVTIVILALLSSSFLFNSQIDKLKKQIDNIYFGNFVPLITLDIVLKNYQTIIKCKKLTKAKCDITAEKTVIIKNWDSYYQSYKTKEERKIVNDVNSSIKTSFKIDKIAAYEVIIKQINFLKEHEVDVAYKQRREFLIDYSNMKDYLFYNLIAIIIFCFAIITFIIYEIIKKDNQLTILNKKYKIESITDSMTKLYNRKYFDTIFDNLPFISNANNWKSAFIMVDIDFFKQYNDTYGHDLGDETLKSVAKELKNYFNKEYEYVFRLGGEEFGIVLFDTNEDILIECLEDINKKIVDLGIEHKGSKVLDVVSISTGAVLYQPYSYISANKLYKIADEKLYKSKQNGRNQFSL
ncbi:diguanylate cyclase domain-containing protein [Arcobacter sp. CECT 8985]|uniref:diguanylate cyclase domain-containing protein n=1 Tax=Arcobacter sp. CECT 8985 TaxID=1935424 RepID=UPI00100BCD45|nr:diguanylate cyclase [Arcobacter sp. CECT 8985]RXJ86479.1 GGDEF domain-containing protein [Arcobacter sp. CECT 8985]